MSLDLYQQQINDRLGALPQVQNVDPGMWDGFIRGTGMATMKGFAKAARAVDLLGAVVPIAQDTFTDGTEAQDKYFAGHDAIFGRAVDYWTPRPQEVGMAGEVMGSLLSVLPQVIVSPSMAVATTQLGTAEDLANVGVTTGKAQAVGAVQALTLGTGIWMPILGKNLWQRAVIGGAGFNLVQGTGARAVSGAILADTQAKDMFKAFDAEAMTLDVLMGLAFGGLAHLSPTQRAQGAAAWDKIESWAKNLNPSDKAAIATLREAQHLNVDSTPGKPMGTPDIEAHVNRMRAAIDQLATDQPVNVEDIKKETGVPPIRTIGVPIRIEGNDPKTVTYSRLDDGRLERTITYDDGDTQTAQLANKANGDEVWVSKEGYERGNFFPKQLDEGEAAKAAAEDAESMGAPRIERQPEAYTAAEGGLATVREAQDRQAYVAGAAQFLAEMPEGGRFDDGLGGVWTVTRKTSAAGTESVTAHGETNAAIISIQRRPGGEWKFLGDWEGAIHKDTSILPAQDPPGGNQPRFEPDPARTAQAEATARDLQAAAETVRAEEGIPPPPQEPPRVVQSVRRTIEEELARAGRPAEEAAAGAAIWDAFYTTMAKRIGTTVEDLWSRFQLPRITNEMPGGQALKQAAKTENLEYQRDQVQKYAKELGYVVDSGFGSGLSKSQYLELWENAKLDEDGGILSGDKLKIRFSDHDLPPTYKRVHGEADYEVSPTSRMDQMGGNWRDAIKWLAERAGKEPPAIVRAIEKRQEIAATKSLIRNAETDVRIKTSALNTYNAAVDAGKITASKSRSSKNWMLRGDGLPGGIGFYGLGRVDGEPFTVDRAIELGRARIAAELNDALSRLEKIKAEQGTLYQDKRNTWYKSALGEAITNLNMKQGDAKAWLQALKGLGNKGVKAEEVKWSGIEEWLQLQEGKITKEQVQEFLANNGVKVEEVMLGGSGGKNLGDPKIAAEVATLDRLGFEPKQHPDENSILAFWDRETDDIVTAEDLKRYAKDDERLGEAADAADRIEQYWYRDSTQADPTKYGTYQLPGGENYRELLLTLPRANEVRIAELRAKWSELANQDPGPERAKAMAAIEKELGDLDIPKQQFQSSHFDQPNILAHIRFNERTDAEGKRVLFIEEIQSDWAQKGKKEGFRFDPAKRWEVFDPRDGRTVAAFATEAEAKADATKRGKEFDYADAEEDLVGKSHLVPAAPFVGKTDAWVGLALKRMIAYAAENGFDRVAWTRGEQQVERYTGALRKAVDVIEWTKTDKGVQLVGYKGTADNRQMAEMRTAVRQIDDEINTLVGNRSVAELTQAEQQHLDNMQARRDDLVDRLKPRNKVVDTTEKEDALSDAIGKAMAEKIISDPNQSGTIEGENIRIDSTGMAGFYDRIVPKVANEVLKKLGGGKVADVSFERKQKEWEVFDPRDGRAIESFDTERQAQIWVEEHPGTDYARHTDGWNVADTSNELSPTRQQGFDITQSMKDKVNGGLPLFQKTKGTERGYMSIGDEGRVIGLLEGADASTFIHESGHFFLETMAEICKLPDVPAAVRADLDTALTWMGLKDPAKWVDMTLDEKRPYHEKFARGWEQYLREGKAPSDELKGVFQRFRDWLVELYKSAKSLNVKLNDDIRGVMNRMLADQTRNPSTEAPPAPSVRPGSPPPPGVDGEAQAGAEAQMRAMLQDMALNETGWAQEGGKLMDQGELGTGKPSFTTWIPKAEWWPARPDKKLNAAKVQEAVRKYLAGEKLKPGEQRTVDYMIDIANARNKGIDTVGGMEEYKALAEEAWDEGLDPTTENVVDLDLVARAAAIDEAYVERAALKYENDDAAFRGELEMLIYETERAQATEAAGRSKAGEQKKAGSQGAEGQKPTDIVRAEADLIVEKNPEMPITVGVNPDGTPMTMTAREFLDQARAEAELNRADIPLLEVAAQCLLGMS